MTHLTNIKPAQGLTDNPVLPVTEPGSTKVGDQLLKHAAFLEGFANMRPRDAAAYLGISFSKLAKLRMEGNQHLGPPYVKVAGCIIYRRADLDAWLEQNLVSK